MKKFTLLSIIGCFVAALAFTSCNTESSGSSYEPLTQQEITQCFLLTQGSYNGKMIYPAVNKANVTDKYDTVQVAWNIRTDSTMTIYNFPAKAIAEQIQYNEGLKAALESQPNQDINCSILYYVKSPIQFIIGPSNLKYNVEYDGKVHDVEINFLWQLPSFGMYNSTIERPMQMQILAARMKVDGYETNYGITTSAMKQFYFYTEK